MINDYRIFEVVHGAIHDNSISTNTLEQLQLDFPAYNGWLIVDPADLPVDFSTDTYTIKNGKLVKASAEVVAERLRLKQVAERESIRIARQQRYDSEEISSLYWDWVESGDEVDKAKWIEAKDVVRRELPYPNNNL